jgi:DNA-binding CsgD family transcriptional regulator
MSAAAEAVRLADLEAQALPSLARGLGASGILLYQYDARGAPMGLGGSLVAGLSSYSPELFAEDPVQHALLRIPTATVGLITLDKVQLAPQRFHRSAAYADWYRRHDVEFLLGVWLTDLHYGAPGMTGLLITRSAREVDFDDRTYERMHHALPAFAAAARRASRLAAVEEERRVLEVAFAGDAAPPRLVLDGRGAVRFCSARAARLLGWTRGGAAPDPLVDAAVRLRALAAGDPATAPFSVVLPLPDGRRVVAALSIARSSTGEPVIAVELGPTGLAPARLAAFAARHGLTRAEAQVLNVLAEGTSNGEIARRLYVSVETVRTHVARLLAKLDVGSRTEAAVRLRSDGD